MPSRHFPISLLALALPLLLPAPAAPAAETTDTLPVEHLGQPCRGKNVLAGRLVTDPATGRELLVLSNTNEASNVELLFIDFDGNTGYAAQAPAGQGAWVLRELPGGRLVVGTYYDGKFMVYDLAARKFTSTVQVPGEEYVFTGATGKDGRFYGGTYPGALLAALDPETLKVETWSRGKSPNLYLRHIFPTPDGRLLCTYGLANTHTLLFDPATEQFTTAPQALQAVQAAANWNGYLLTGSQAFDGKTLEPVSPLPFPAPSEGTTWTVNTTLTTSDTLYLTDGRALYSFRAGETALKPVVRMDPRLITGLRGVTRDGRLVGSWGQDYYVIRPGDAEPRLRPIPVESGGRPPHFLKADGKGKLWGGPWFGQTLFSMDPATSQVVNTGNVSFRGGEVYDVEFLHGKVYAVSYVGGELIEYDPAQPFDLWKGKNPRTLSTLNPDYIRPEAGVCVSPDGLLYSGYMAKYGTYGGAIAVTDPVSSRTEVFKNPLGPQAITGLAVDGKSLFVSTGLGGNGLKPNPEGFAQFAVLDRATREPLFRHEFREPKATTVHDVVLDTPTSTVAMQAGKALVLFDAAAGKLRPELTASFPPVTGVLTGDNAGHLVYGSEKELVEVTLGATPRFRKWTMPGKVEKLTADGRTVYFSSGPDVYRVQLPKE